MERAVLGAGTRDGEQVGAGRLAERENQYVSKEASIIKYSRKEDLVTKTIG
jgi:hypothetical protein